MCSGINITTTTTTYIPQPSYELVKCYKCEGTGKIHPWWTLWRETECDFCGGRGNKYMTKY